ncbi:MFS transporter [Serratia nevei]|uniref:MFS transporter n=1 Tax=Serratia nevei TaxID=2703794 RepID=UPI003314912B
MRAFFLLCVSRAGLCLGTMMFAGALPTIRSEWQLDAASAGTVQTVFSLTNALALLVASWWCDSLGARRVYLLFSWLGAAALMLFAVFAHSYAGALVLMAFVGLTQGGAYTPALLLAMGMNGPARRGYAIGMMLAASSLGYFLSVFIAGWSAMRWGVRWPWSVIGNRSRARWGGRRNVKVMLSPMRPCCCWPGISPTAGNCSVTGHGRPAWSARR